MTTVPPTTDRNTPRSERSDGVSPKRVALIGNPNTGKTTLFNRLCGLRAQTANYPGSTAEARIGHCRRNGQTINLIDLPGIYGMELDLPESKMCRECLDGRLEDTPDSVLVLVDSTNPTRGLEMAIAAIRRRLPTIVALTMSDLAKRRGLSFDTEKLSERLGVQVVAVSARTGRGLDALLDAILAAKPGRTPLPTPDTPAEERRAWIDETLATSVGGGDAVGDARDSLHDRLDKAFTHPVSGMLAFILVMAVLFWTIFSLASLPMDLVDLLFGTLGEWAGAIIPEGALRDLVVDGVIGGIAGTVIFLPQILILFFLLALLEDTGYLARAAFVMDRVMCRFGLPGQAFVPLLSSHACALPGIMSARLVPDRSDRLTTVLVAPFMSCTARIPVYVLLIGLLFADRPFLAGVAFAGCYLLGAIAALLSAMLARRTILPGKSRPMVLELPEYRIPSIRSAILLAWGPRTHLRQERRHGDSRHCDRDVVAQCLPQDPGTHRCRGASQGSRSTRTSESRTGSTTGITGRSTRPPGSAGRLICRPDRHLRPAAFCSTCADRTLTVGILTSFLAREVFVSTVIVLEGGGEDVDDEHGVLELLGKAIRDDGTPIFNTATSASILVFFVLAMQCLPTLAVTRRETGSWKWPALQFAWMTGLAWILAAIVHAVVSASMS